MSQTRQVNLPGRLGNPDETLGSDPRTDPRIAAVMTAFGLDGHGEPAPVDGSSPFEQQLEFCTAAEPDFQMLFGALYAELPPIEGVTSKTETITGVDGNEISLYLHRPAEIAPGAPGILHIHGGGMTILTAADPSYVRWRDELAALGAVVVGVEFRNAAGVLGPHQFPAGLNDCGTALQWMHDQRDSLGISTIVVSGESGGGNLTLATALKAKRDGRLDQIDGVYAQCPYISGLYATQPPELPSMTENDEYFLACRMMGAMAAVYTGGAPSTDPLAWPYHADVSELEGLPPHVISVNQLDPLRDEGLAYFRKLLDAGVAVASRTVNGTCHAGDVIFRAAMPEVYAASARDLVGFAGSL
jgi:acetyl esterase/lipase